jgi:hypothetical protein
MQDEAQACHSALAIGTVSLAWPIMHAERDRNASTSAAGAQQRVKENGRARVEERQNNDTLRSGDPMRSPARPISIVCLGVLMAVATAGTAQRATTAAPPQASAGDATARIVKAAEAVLASLDAAGRAKVQFRLDDAAQKLRWSNLPSPMFERQGIRLGDLTAPQRTAVMTLLQAALSPMGYRKVTEIMQGDEYLRVNGDGRGPRGGGPPAGSAPRGGGPPPGGNPGGRAGRGGGPSFGQDEYYLAFLGTPSTTSPWILQYGGHHLAINLTLSGSRASMAPSLPATQPATFTFEGREIRPLGREND